ncbi:MAG TPA: glycosyltransferase family 2 protein [Thermoanaerobaculia bacterium]|nr:glycosyltransferase family 2 protein [Thermoanaerobaculia bacterium]
MKVSVVMPVHNGARFLEESLASIVGDAFDELVIVDDGSTDATPALLGAWAAREPRIVIVTLERNRGLAHALNRGLETARGEYVARHDADEVYVRGRIAAQVEMLDRERDVVLVSTWFDIIDEQGRRTGTYRPSYSPEEIDYLLNFYNVLGGHAQVMFRREAALRAGRYAEEFSTVEDYDLWRRLRRLGRIVILPRIGLLRRHHSSGVSFAQRTQQRALSGQVMRLAVGDTLGRAISDEEAKAIATLWRGAYHAGLVSLAVRLSRGAGDMRRLLRRRVLYTAARALRRGHVRDAVQWLRTAGSP